MALGITFWGFSVSPAVSPTSSIPTKAKTTIWKDRINPCHPFGNMPPWLQRLLRLAGPEAAEKPFAIRRIPVTIRASMAMTLINANQNSNSPKSLTVARFMISRIISARRPAAIEAHREANIAYKCRPPLNQPSRGKSNRTSRSTQ